MVGRGPGPLRQRTPPDPDLQVMRVPVTDLRPQRDLSPQHVLLVRIAGHHPPDVQVVQVQPTGVTAVVHPVVVPHSHIDVEGPVLRDHHLVLGLG